MNLIPPPKKRVSQQTSSVEETLVAVSSIRRNNREAIASPSPVSSAPDISEPLKKYVRIIRERLASRWSMPRSDAPISLAVLFRLHRNGDISKLRLEFSSGSNVVDMAALEAVEKSVHFPRIPSELPDFLDLRFLIEPGFGDEYREVVHKTINRLVPPARTDRP